MFCPAIYANVLGRVETAMVFFSTAAIMLLVVGCLALAVANRPNDTDQRAKLITLLGCFLALPAIAALPLWRMDAGLSASEAFFQMLAALTTTGFTLSAPQPGDAPVITLWGGLVAWMGGYLTIVGAVTILRPLRLGGFEVRQTGPSAPEVRQLGPSAPKNIFKSVRDVAKVYVTITAALFVGLVICGEAPDGALIYAMAIISTSGITGDFALVGLGGGLLCEVLIFGFFLFALTHSLFVERSHTRWGAVWHDLEVRTGVIAVLILTAMLAVFHTATAYDAERSIGILDSLREIWGLLFTLMSFLTTTGIESIYWDIAEAISGLQSPTLVLLCAALLGGGIATTAGGLKLIRIYALMSHGNRELSRLVHPNSVGSTGTQGRLVRREGAYIAWIFCMLFVTVLAGGVLGLAAGGLGFEDAFVLSVAALSNVGPLALVNGTKSGLEVLSPEALMIVNVLMIVGRLEILAVAAILNPEYWRR